MWLIVQLLRGGATNTLYLWSCSTFAKLGDKSADKENQPFLTVIEEW